MTFAFGACEIDCDRRELHRTGSVIHVEPQVFDLLVHLVRHRDRVVTKEELLHAVWHGRSVSDDALTSRVSAERRAIGDTGTEQRLIRTVPRRGFRFVGDVREASTASGAPTAVLSSSGGSPAVQQRVAFCRTSDGVHLAFATAGRGLPLVKTANWLNHIEFDWQSPVWSPMFSRLAVDCQLVRYDERGTGLSDREVSDFSFEAFVHDLETVVDECGLARFALLGISQGAPVAIAYAVRHPERVSRLVLCGGFAKGWRKRGNAEDVARAEASITLIRDGWGRDNPAARQMFTSLIVPDATHEEMRWFNDLERVSGLRSNRYSSATGHRRHRCHGVVASRRGSHARLAQSWRRSRALRAWPDARTCDPPTPASWPSRARIISSCLMSPRGPATSTRSVDS